MNFSYLILKSISCFEPWHRLPYLNNEADIIVLIMTTAAFVYDNTNRGTFPQVSGVTTRVFLRDLIIQLMKSTSVFAQRRRLHCLNHEVDPIIWMTISTSLFEQWARLSDFNSNRGAPRVSGVNTWVSSSDIIFVDDNVDIIIRLLNSASLLKSWSRLPLE